MTQGEEHGLWREDNKCFHHVGAQTQARYLTPLHHSFLVRTRGHDTILLGSQERLNGAKALSTDPSTHWVAVASYL